MLRWYICIGFITIGKTTMNIELESGIFIEECRVDSYARFS